MTDEQVQEVEQVEQTEEESQDTPAETDWKSEARKWERLAKKGKAAEEELEALKQQQMTEQEKATARAEKAEAELEALKEQQQMMQDAKTIAERDGIPIDLLLYCKDTESMESFAKTYLAANPPKQVHAAPSAQGTRIVKDNEQGLSNAQRFAQFAGPMFK